MTRNTAAAVTSASSLPVVRYRILCEIDSLTGGTLRMSNGNEFIRFNSNTYSPLGTLASMDKVQEDSEIYPRAVRLKLAAVQSAQIVDLINETYFNKPVRLYRTFLTDSYTVVSTPEPLFSGFVNMARFNTGDKESYFEIEVESRLIRQPRVRYFTREVHQFVMGYSGDTFFDLVPMIPLTKANWGGHNINVNKNPMPAYDDPYWDQYV